MSEGLSSFNMNGEEDQREHWIFRYFSGNISALNEWLDSKHFIFHFPTCVLRAIGQPIFVNNPISGAFILAGMFVGNWWSAVNGLVGLLSAIVAALIFKQSRGDIKNGSITFHGLLIGIVLGATYSKTSTGAPDPNYYILIISSVLGMLSVPVATGLGNLAGKLGIPAFNFPFNIIAFSFLAAIGNSNHHFPVNGKPIVPTIPVYDDWGEMFHAIPNSLSQIYGSDDYISGILILIGVLICSPLFFFHAIFAATVGIITSWTIAFTSPAIGSGVTCFNAVLSAMCLGGFFYTPSIASSVLALLSAIFSTVIFATMNKLTNMIPLAIPFNISAGILVAASCKLTMLKRVPMDQLTYPENHYKVFRETPFLSYSEI